MSSRRLWLAAPLIFACASTPPTVLVDGREVPRPTLELSGQPYRVRHTRAYPNPGSPSSGLTDAGGNIRGRVCGTSVDYAVAHQGDHVQLKGSVEGPLPSTITIREDGEKRTFEGKLGRVTVALELRDDSLQGHVGQRHFELHVSEGDRMLGISSAGPEGALPVEVHGLQALQDMPAADQGAVLPTLLSCDLMTERYAAPRVLVIGFGGKVTEAPPRASSR